MTGKKEDAVVRSAKKKVGEMIDKAETVDDVCKLVDSLAKLKKSETDTDEWGGNLETPP